jgi:NADH-quinone oxidoreductase subunit E
MVHEPADQAGARRSGAEALEEAILSSVPPVILPPLLAPSAGAFAAAAAMGIGFANQMTGAYLGLLKGAVESSRIFADALGVTEIDRLAVSAEEAGATDAGSGRAATAGQGATILPLTRKPPVLVLAESLDAEPVKALEKTDEPRPATAPKAKAPVKVKAKVKAKKPSKTEPATAAAPVATVTPANAADLKRLPGVGPKLEKMLKARGLATLADVAALTEQSAEALDAELGLDGRIARDGWVKAAAALL